MNDVKVGSDDSECSRHDQDFNGSSHKSSRLRIINLDSAVAFTLTTASSGDFSRSLAKETVGLFLGFASLFLA